MKYDVIIVGAGIIGLATAERLLKQNISVLILERGQVGRESSWAGGGILSPLLPWQYTDAVTHLAQYSVSLFPEWTSKLYTATGIDPEYDPCGMLVLPPYDLEAAEHWCTKNLVKMSRLAFPGYISTGKSKWSVPYNTEYAISLPDTAQVRNPRLLRALHQHVIQLGGKIIEYCEVFEMVVKQKKIQSLQTSCGQLIAHDFIIAAGAWSTKVLGSNALNLDISPMCGQMLLFKFNTVPFTTILIKGKLYFIPRKDGHLLVGSTLENKGFNKQVTPSARNQLLQQALTIMPELKHTPIVRQWSGLRPASPDNVPTISRHPELTNLFINSGHHRYGVTLAPASAEIMTHIITGAPQPININCYQTGWRKSAPSLPESSG